MYLENLVFDAVNPRRVGRFWESALATTTLTDSPEGLETRLVVDGGPVLDLCFQRVAEPTVTSPRLHLDLHGGTEQADVVERLLGLGASHLDIGQGDVPWVVLADPEGHAFCVMEDRAEYRDTGPIAAVPVLGTDPERDASFWAEMSGWEVRGRDPIALGHPSGRGPLLEFFPEQEPKTGKNRLHLDLRLEPGDDLRAVLDGTLAAGAATLDHDWGDVPWTVLADPSGNEFCILPGASH